MKMKEVCTLTGLTERAVRLYCEQELRTPSRTEVRGRVYLEFDEQHIKELNQIAALRASGFTLEEIRTVRNEPHLIGRLLQTLSARLAHEQDEHSRVLSVLAEIDSGNPPVDMDALCRALQSPEPQPRAYENGAVLRDDGPSFREFCARGGYPSDTETILDRNIARGRIVMIVFRILYWLQAALTLLSNFSYGAVLGGLIVLAVQIVFYIYLFRGVTWIRVLIVLYTAVQAFFAFAFMAEAWPGMRVVYMTDVTGAVEQITERTGAWSGVLIFGLLGLICALGVYFLGFNRWVSDYLYDCSTL